MAKRYKRRCVYYITFKLRVIDYSKNHSIRLTAKKYKLSRKIIREWEKKEQNYRSKYLFYPTF